MARAVVAGCHGAAAAAAAEQDFDRRFRDRAVPLDAPAVRLPAGAEVHLPALLVDAGLCTSRGQGRRLVDAGGLRLDGVVVAAGSYDAARRDLVGTVLQAGRRRSARLVD